MKKFKSKLVIFIRHTSLLIPLLVLSFSTGDNKSYYSIPLAAWSVTAGDIDQDGDNDIIVGHNYSSQNWSGVSITINYGNGIMSFNDSVFIYGGQSNILLENLNSGLNKEIVCNHIDTINDNTFIAIIEDYNLNDISYFNLNTDESIGYRTVGDINGDGFTDIIFASHIGQFWGIIYNDEFGNFSLPEYHNVSDYYPSAIACGDLNEDCRDDIVICGQNTEVYFSYPQGYQCLVLETYNFKEGVSIEDFDLDGDNDILTVVGIPVANVTSLIMYENHGNNLFDTINEFYFQPMSDRFFVTDFDNDNLQDILFQLSNKTGFIIYYNQGDFQLSDSQFVSLPPSNPQEAWRNCCSADIDGNGYNDIIAVKTLNVYLPDNLSILFNDGQGNFVEDPITGNEIPNSEIQEPNITCYPNPFNGSTCINYILDNKATVIVYLFDYSGKPIMSFDYGTMDKGSYFFKFSSYGLSSGIYIFSLEVNGNICDSKKMTLMK